MFIKFDRSIQKYYNIQINENSCILIKLLNKNAHYSAIFESLWVNASYFLKFKMTPRIDYVSLYVNSSLSSMANYVSRSRLHQKIKEQLRDSTNDQERRILIIWELARVEKSQLMLNEIQEYSQNYFVILCIEVESKKSIERDYLQIYWLLYYCTVDAGQKMLKMKNVISTIKSWFYRRVRQWLIDLKSADVIDNDQVKSYIDLKYFILDTSKIHVIVILTLKKVEVANIESLKATKLFRKCLKMKKIEQNAKTEVNKLLTKICWKCLKQKILCWISFLNDKWRTKKKMLKRKWNSSN